MGRIYKYELIRRKSSIILFSSVMLGMTIISIFFIFIVPTSSLLHQVATSNTWPMPVWIMITLIALIVIPISMMFTCSSGHIGELLFKDTNYLMLTIPIEPWKILLGRILAGFTELIIYSIIATISFFSIIVSLVPTQYMSRSNFVRTCFLNISENGSAVLVVFISILSSVLLIGAVIMFVRILTRSLIRKKRITEIFSIILFIFLFYLLNAFFENISNILGWVIPIQTKLYSISNSGLTVNETSNMINLPIVTPIAYSIMATVFFLISEWLLKHKVEV